MKYAKLTIETYLNKLAHKTPVPGGGSTAALFGALGCALMEMVVNYSIDKKNRRVVKSASDLKKIRKCFINSIDEDITAYNRLSLYYKRYNKDSAKMQSALKKATLAPLKTCKKSYEAIKLCSKLLNIVNRNLISDIGCAASGLISAFKSAKFNVAINIKYIKDKKIVDSIQRQLTFLDKKISLLEGNITKYVGKTIG